MWTTTSSMLLANKFYEDFLHELFTFKRFTVKSPLGSSSEVRPSCSFLSCQN